MLTFLLASIALTLSPGPDILYVLTQSISNGKKFGIATAAGLVSGILVHTTLIALGVSAIIKQSELIFTGIKIVGACYLLWIAFQVYKAPASIDLNADSKPKKSPISLYKQGFIMNVLNPKVTLFFLAFFPGFIDEKLGNVTQQIYLLGFLFMLQAFVIFSLVSILADKLTVFIRNNIAFSIFLKWFQIAVFIAIAVLILI
ncbi:MAG TPA: LysE family translocator [Flavobacterium sp.]|uniref:LysE family translocator n=1 Tax=unclassified Flavobacterium TaxID=196869 RepID=UPI000E88F762|nr:MULTISPECIES: LysE family translocator [unclassified Flavobacterium]HBI00597.1 lysine transporter LysE [Flavobacterium sp.]HRE76854.1 LysE family translocator [Flavobacterium sp.]